MGTGEFNAGGNPAMDWHPIQGGVEIFLVASCHGNRDKLRPGGPLGSYADFTLPVICYWTDARQHGIYLLNSATLNVLDTNGSESVAYTLLKTQTNEPKEKKTK